MINAEFPILDYHRSNAANLLADLLSYIQKMIFLLFLEDDDIEGVGNNKYLARRLSWSEMTSWT